MKVLKINLTNGTNEVVETKINGLIEYSIKKHLSEQTYNKDPLSEDNTLLISTGQLGDKRLPGSFRAIISARSPLTNGFFFSTVGGFGEDISKAGINIIELHGKASKSSIIIIKRQQGELEVKVEPVSNLSELYEEDGVFALQEWMAREYADYFKGLKHRSIVAGPSGFNTVIGGLSSVNIKGDELDYGSEGFAGRGGFGSVMAQAHNIAGLMIGGDVESRNDELMNLVNSKLDEPLMKRVTDKTVKYRSKGTLISNYESQENDTLMFNWNSTLLTKEERIALYNKLIKNKILKQVLQESIKSKTCGESCPAVCKKSITKHVMDYEPYSSCGPNMGVFNLSDVERVVNVVDSMGFDGISFGNLISALFDGINKGLIRKEDFNIEQEPLFNEQDNSRINADIAVKLAKEIAFGKQPLLSQSVRALSESKGLTSSVYFAFGSKGCIAPNQYLRPGFITPLPILGKFTTYYGKGFVEPRELGKLSAERLIKELYFEDNGYCRFHRGWIEDLMPELIEQLNGVSDYHEHVKGLIKLIIDYNDKADSMPVKWVNNKVEQLIKAHVIISGESLGDNESTIKWKEKFNKDFKQAISDYWNELKKGVDEVLL